VGRRKTQDVGRSGKGHVFGRVRGRTRRKCQWNSDPASSGMNLAFDSTFFDLLAGSYSRLVGGSLIPPEHDNQHAVRWLYEEAPYCVLAHNTDPDPVFIYGNKTAQACFEYAWDELTSLRSRLSA
jgi:hypothetical protein